MSYLTIVNRNLGFINVMSGDLITVMDKSSESFQDSIQAAYGDSCNDLNIEHTHIILIEGKEKYYVCSEDEVKIYSNTDKLLYTLNPLEEKGE